MHADVFVGVANTHDAYLAGSLNANVPGSSDPERSFPINTNSEPPIPDSTDNVRMRERAGSGSPDKTIFRVRRSLFHSIPSRQQAPRD